MSLSPESSSPGWYADPSGGNGQRYWDGQQWLATPAPSSDDRVTKTDIKNWAKNGVAGYSAILGAASIALNILCGIGIALGIPALLMGFFAYQSSEQGTPAKKLALTGMIAGAIGSAISVVGWMVIMAMGVV